MKTSGVGLKSDIQRRIIALALHRGADFRNIPFLEWVTTKRPVNNLVLEFLTAMRYTRFQAHRLLPWLQEGTDELLIPFTRLTASHSTHAGALWGTRGSGTASILQSVKIGAWHRRRAALVRAVEEGMTLLQKELNKRIQAEIKALDPYDLTSLENTRRLLNAEKAKA